MDVAAVAEVVVPAVCVSLAMLLPLAAADGGAHLVVSSGLRLRAAPRADAALVEKVGVGTVLDCSERSAPVAVGGQRGAFCRAHLDDGRAGWYFEPLTEPLAADREAQERRLIARKLEELAAVGEERWPDVYDVHLYLVRRVEQAAAGEPRLRARFDELRLLRAQARAFHADPRVYRDEAQGWRLKREALYALVAEAAGTPIAEAVAWEAVLHGHDFECEGFSTCVVSTLVDVECRYLAQFSAGPHAAAAVERIATTASELAGSMPGSEMGHDGLDAQLAKLRACLAPLTQGPVARARAALQDVERAARATAAEPAPVP